MPRSKEGLIEHPELRELEDIDDEIIEALRRDPSLAKQQARSIATRLAVAKKAYYSTCSEFDIVRDVDARPFDTATWDIALANARNNKWSSLSALLRQDAQPFLIDEGGNGEDLALGLALTNLARLIE